MNSRLIFNRFCFNKNSIKLFLIMLLCFSVLNLAGCQARPKISRLAFSEELKLICRAKFQASVFCREAGDTIWIYLPYTPGRYGQAATAENLNNLYIEYTIASFNPYKVIEPPELKFLIQKATGEIRQLLLRMTYPYKFFILVVTNISSTIENYDNWYIGYLNDVKNYSVGKDFSGEGYSRLVWHQEPIKIIEKAGEKVSAAFRDKEGNHVDYHEMTLREFVNKQIKWRIYKRFTIEYNKIPFDLNQQEKEDEVIKIIQDVLRAYNFNEFEAYYLSDKSFLEEEKFNLGFTRRQIEERETLGISRKPAF